MKKDFDNSRRLEPAKPKQPPTRKATVSSPSPAPSPSGDVPRTTAKKQTVPAKDWSKAPAASKPVYSKPAKVDWDKTGASKPKANPPKDWSKAVDKERPLKKAPTPRKDLDRSR